MWATIGDAHIYANHFDQVKEQLQRQPKALPKLVIEEGKSIFGMTIDDIKAEGYDPHPPIKAPIAV
mgnify:FL=1